MNYYRHWLGDYMRDTAHLSMMEHGAYRMLLDHYYATERPLPLFDAVLIRITSASKLTEKRALRSVLDQFFERDEAAGCYRHKRADEEIALTKQRVEASRRNGRKGGRPPEKETQSKPSGLAKQNLDLTQQKPSGKAIHTPDPKEKDLSPPELAKANSYGSSELAVANIGPCGPAELNLEPNGWTKRINGEEVKAVIRHLNQTVGGSFRIKNPAGKPTAHADRIRAILRSGYSVADCCAVIDRKAGDWLNDDKMARYLTPETLFRKSNFEKYLDEPGRT